MRERENERERFIDKYTNSLSEGLTDQRNKKHFWQILLVIIFLARSKSAITFDRKLLFQNKMTKDVFYSIKENLLN